MLTMAWNARRLTTPTTSQLPRLRPTATFSGRPCRAGWRRCVAARAVQGETATDLTGLKAALNRAVQAEDYQEAAKLRDLIKGATHRVHWPRASGGRQRFPPVGH